MLRHMVPYASSLLDLKQGSGQRSVTLYDDHAVGFQWDQAEHGAGGLEPGQRRPVPASGFETYRWIDTKPMIKSLNSIPGILPAYMEHRFWFHEHMEVGGVTSSASSFRAMKGDEASVKDPMDAHTSDDDDWDDEDSISGTPSTQFSDADPQQDPQQPSLTRFFLGTVIDAKLVVRACQAKRLLFYDFPPEGILPLAGSVYVLDIKVRGLLVPEPALWVFEDCDGEFFVYHLIKDIDLKMKVAVLLVGKKVYQIISYYRPWQTVNGELIQPTKCELFCDDPFFNVQFATLAVPLSPMEYIRSKIEGLGKYQLDYKQLVMLIILGWTEESYHQSLMNQLSFPRFPAEPIYWLTLSQLPTFAGKSPEELRAQAESILAVLFGAVAAPKAASPVDRSFSPLQNRAIFFEMFQPGVPARETFSWPGGVMLDEIARLFGTPNHCSTKEEEELPLPLPPTHSD